MKWMAWTPPTAGFFAAIALILAVYTVWGVLSPSIPRRGLLPMPTTLVVETVTGPRMADLRESGAIERDADLVLLLHRPEYYDPNDQPGLAEVIVAKNRNGRTGTVRLAYRKDISQFQDYCPV